MEIKASTDVYCILGNPVRHSLSPAIHNTSFKSLGINALYCAFSPTSIKSGLEAMRSLGIKGASITIPFKSEALHYVDELDEMAELAGSINTVVNREGRLMGYNTDGHGALQSLQDGGIAVPGRRFLILGNGGSARAIAAVLLKNGAAVTIAGRSRNNVDALTGRLMERFNKVSGLLIPSLDRKILQETDVVINTTPIGMVPDTEKVPIDTGLIGPEHTVFDIVYAPHRTRLLREAKKKGCRTIYGIDMLINQGIRQFELWTGAPAPRGVVMRALKKFMAKNR